MTKITECAFLINLGDKLKNLSCPVVSKKSNLIGISFSIFFSVFLIVIIFENFSVPIVLNVS
jgi:hypothetical protein